MDDGTRLTGHAFISYVREDAQRVEQLQRILETAGIPVWRDTADLWPGEDWHAKIRQAITDDALVFIACFSTASLARPKTYQNEELAVAIEQLRLRRLDVPWLIPVRFDECVIPHWDIGGGRSLESIQYVDLFGDHFNDGAAKLAEAVRRILVDYARVPPASIKARSETDRRPATPNDATAEPRRLGEPGFPALVPARRPRRVAAVVAVAAAAVISTVAYIAVSGSYHSPGPDGFPARSASSRSASARSVSGPAPATQPTAARPALALANWSRAVPVDTAGQLTAVACATPSRCAAVGDDGGLFTYDGRSWSSPVSTDNLLGGVSCPSVSFCEAVGYNTTAGSVVTFDGNSWTAPRRLDPGFKLHSVSCLSASFCVVGAAVDMFTYSHGVWSAPQIVDPEDTNGYGVSSVSCVSLSFCLAVDAVGDALLYTNGSWPSPRVIDDGVRLTAASCASISFCLIVGAGGNAIVYANGLWSTPQVVDRGVQLDSVSCMSASFCLAVDARGDALTYMHGTWSVPRMVDDGVPFNSVSCVSPSFCLAVDADGDALYLR